MIDGKEFFADDPNIAMKNLPVNIIDKIRAYEKQSDMARVTGIEDGEEETVLDLSVKPGMNHGFFGNVDGAYGTEKDTVEITCQLFPRQESVYRYRISQQCKR